MRTTAATRILALPFLVIAFGGYAGAENAASKESDGPAKAEVLQAGKRFDEARAAKDKPAIERILADGLAWTARGERLGKAQVISDFMSENLHFKYFAHDNVVATMFGNTAVVTGHSTSILEYKGKLFDAPRLFTDVWVKLDGRWQLVMHHVSDLAKS